MKSGEFLKTSKDITEIIYKASDLKPEIHFIGQILGASNVAEEDGLFLEAFFESGDTWICLSPNFSIQTQTCYKNVKIFYHININIFIYQMEDFTCFSHPFDLHYTAENIYGWPKLIARLWKLDDTNKVDLRKNIK